MRPQSEIRVTLAAALVDGPGTCRQLAQRTGWSVGLTRCALDNMVRAGDAAKPSSVRVVGVKRPVPVYVRATRIAAAESCGAHLTSLITAWALPRLEAMFPDAARMGAAM
jgi:hypothetical protein